MPAVDTSASQKPMKMLSSGKNYDKQLSNRYYRRG